MSTINFTPLSQEVINSLAEPELIESITSTFKCLQHITELKNCVAMQYQLLNSRHTNLQRQRIIDEDQVIKVRTHKPVNIKNDASAKELSQLLENIDLETLHELENMVSKMLMKN